MHTRACMHVLAGAYIRLLLARLRFRAPLQLLGLCPLVHLSTEHHMRVRTGTSKCACTNISFVAIWLHADLQALMHMLSSLMNTKGFSVADTVLKHERSVLNGPQPTNMP